MGNLDFTSVTKVSSLLPVIHNKVLSNGIKIYDKDVGMVVLDQSRQSQHCYSEPTGPTVDRVGYTELCMVQSRHKDFPKTVGFFAYICIITAQGSLSACTNLSSLSLLY